MLPNIPFTKFKQLKAQDITESKSFVVTSDGEPLGFFIIPRTEYVRQSVEEFGLMSNLVGGKEVSELIGGKHDNL